jgi:hypothetical protein
MGFGASLQGPTVMQRCARAAIAIAAKKSSPPGLPIYDILRTIEAALPKPRLETVMRRIALLVAFLSLCSTPLFAATSAQPVVIKDVPKFLNYQRDLRDDMKKDPKFKHVDNGSKEKVFAAQDTLFELLDGKSSIDQLSEAERVEAFNAQAQITAVLTDAELDRPVCKRERKIGSNRLETVCTTKRQRNEQHDAAQGLRHPRACAGELCSGAD